MFKSFIILFIFALFSYKATAEDICPVCQEPLDEYDSKLSCGHGYHAQCIYNAYSNNIKCCPICQRPISSEDLHKIHSEVLEKLIALLALLSKPIQVMQDRETFRKMIAIHQQQLQLAIDQEQMQLVLQQNQRDLQAQDARIQRDRVQLQQGQGQLVVQQEQMAAQQVQIDAGQAQLVAAQQQMQVNRDRLAVQQQNHNERVSLEFLFCTAALTCAFAVLMYNIF